MSERNHPQTLQTPQPGNTNPLTHGAYAAAPREPDPAAEAVADWLMPARHTGAVERIAATEIGALVMRIIA